MSEQQKPTFKKFVDELRVMQLLELLNSDGQIIVVDDETFTLETMRMQFEALKIEEKRMWLFQDGQMSLSHFQKILDGIYLPEEVENGSDDYKINIQPVSLLILDINMPIVTGLQICARVKALYSEKQTEIDASLQNSRLEEKKEEENDEEKQIESHTGNKMIVQIVRPMIVFVSSHDYNTMKLLCHETEKADCFFRKPFKMVQLRSIMQKLRLIEPV